MSNSYGNTSLPGNLSSAISVSKTFSGAGSNTFPLFTVAGAVRVYDLWGVVTTAIGTNHTSGYLRLNDQTSTTNITANPGATLSSLPVGSLIKKTGLASAVLTFRSAAAGALLEPATAGQTIASPFDVVAKNTATTNIEYVYTTSNSSGGVVTFYLSYDLLSETSSVTLASGGGGG